MTGSTEARLSGVIKLVDADHWYASTGSGRYPIHLCEAKGFKLADGRRVTFIARQRGGEWRAVELKETYPAPPPTEHSFEDDPRRWLDNL